MKLLKQIFLLAFIFSLFMVTGCKKNNDENKENDGHTHEPSDWVVLKEATCTEEGKKQKKCNSCGEVLKEETIKKLEHNYTDGKCTMCKGNDPNCKEPSEGLKYELSSDGTYYSVSEIGTCIDIDVVIPNLYNNLPVTSIGDYAFYRCENLRSIIIPESVTSIGGAAFKYCISLESITIPNSVTSIGNEAFSKCTSLESITIPNSVTSIGGAAFYECSSLESIEIPNSVTSIGTYTFFNCTNLTSILIPDSVISIEPYQFKYCTSLTNIEVDSKNEYYKSIDGNLYSKDGKTLIHYAIGKKDSTFYIPSSVTRIEFEAFHGCSSLTSITIPNSVTSIGGEAFYECRNLTSITIPNSVTSIGDWAFKYCTSLRSIIIPNSVTSIGYEAFYGCSSLISIEIPESVTSISSAAFHECDNLTIYCEADSKPTGWYTEWNSSNCPVYWAGQWEYSESGNPIPLN